MTKSTITRERAQQIFLGNGPEPSASEERELARMALAAMDGESWCLPLDYLQGRKDGLEWAAQLAEANHPDTGDWLYDDPIELAKAIRKGPDMPPVQPVADSEPDRDPVLAYADSYRDMAKQGVESVPIWSVITDLERNIAPLYRHAQPVTVVPDKMTAIVKDEAEYVEGWNACRAAMLAVAPQPQNAPQNIPEIIPGGLVEAVNNLLNNDGSRGCYDAMECNAARVEIELWLAQRQRQREQRKTNLSAGISPVIPEGWQVEAEKLAEIYGMSFVLFRHGEAPQCADPTKVVISFTDKGLGHDTLPAAHQEVK